MVQLFYYENLGKNYRKLVSYEGIPFRVNLTPYEDVGSALSSYWIVKIPWWRRSVAKILEVSGCHYHYATGKVVDSGNGNITIKGSFHKATSHEISKMMQYTSTAEEKLISINSTICLPKSMRQSMADDFCLHLSTNVSDEDFQNGYSMSGTLERGYRKVHAMVITHIAMVKRKGY